VRSSGVSGPGFRSIASGTPCVLTRQCEVPGLQAAGGGLVTECDPEAFAVGLRTVISDRRWAAGARAARRTILASQTAERRADTYADLFHQLVGATAPAWREPAARDVRIAGH